MSFNDLLVAISEKNLPLVDCIGLIDDVSWLCNPSLTALAYLLHRIWILRSDEAVFTVDFGFQTHSGKHLPTR